MKMPFFIVSNIAIVVPMSHPLPWNDPLHYHHINLKLNILSLWGEE